MAKRAASSAAKKVTRDDIERELRALQGDVRDKVDEKRNTMLIAAGVVGVIVVMVVFLLGRRSGRHKNTVVEIRRV
jgi:uncharacterized membrane protein YvbJ